MLLVVSFAACVVTLLASIGVWRSKGRSLDSWRFGMAFFWLLVPILLDLAVSVSIMPMFLNRYLIICGPPLALLVSKGLRSIRPKWIGGALFCVMLSAEAFGLPQYYGYRMDYREWKSTTGYILEQSRAGDSIIFCMASGRLLFDYYRERYFPQAGENLLFVYPDLKTGHNDPNALAYLPPLNIGSLNAVVARGDRVWVVLYPDELAPTTEQSRLIQTILSARYQNMQETRIDTVIIRLYAGGTIDRKAAPAVSGK